MTGCDLCEGAPDRTHRRGRGDRGCGRQRPRPPRAPGHADRRFGGRDLLDRVPALAGTARAERREAGDLRRGRGPEGRRDPDPRRHMASAAACTSSATCWPMPAARAGASSPPSSPPPSPRRTPTARRSSGARSPTSSGPRCPKLAVLMDEAEDDVLAYMGFPREHAAEIALHKPDRTAPCRGQASHQRRRHLSQGGLHHTARRRHPARVRTIEWAVSRRYMTLESIAPLSDGVSITLPTVAA